MKRVKLFQLDEWRIELINDETIHVTDGQWQEFPSYIEPLDAVTFHWSEIIPHPVRLETRRILKRFHQNKLNIETIVGSRENEISFEL